MQNNLFFLSLFFFTFKFHFVTSYSFYIFNFYARGAIFLHAAKFVKMNKFFVSTIYLVLNSLQAKGNMGGTQSSTGDKQVEATGQVANSIIIQHQAHSIEIITILLAVTCAIKIIEFLFFVGGRFNGMLRRRYGAPDPA